ncbi:MAG: exodeoxyribonuclease VII small subunit [Desulfamplus sp.]|nr:exodeoxyribonuclease VII small subunit [Desulfamplus sp.]
MAKKKTFESSLGELEQIVKELESGDLPLEEAVRKFETGMECSRFCREKLNETEKKITLLMHDGQGHIQEHPLDNNDD